MKIIRQSFLVIIMVCIVAEIVLRMQGGYKVYQEQIGNSYATDYGKILPTWYYNWTPNTVSIPVNTDFKYEYAINDLGFREKKIVEQKKDSVLRIIVIGDSYTEGVGAPYDSTWPRMLEKELLQQNIRAEVINAGRSGSDVFYDYVFYRDKLSRFKPDIVISAFNLTDYQDYIFRGGMERFQADSTTHYSKAPWYEPVYQYSHLFRAVMFKLNNYPFSGIFISQHDYVTGWKTTTTLFAEIINKFKTDAEKDGAVFVSIVHTTPCELVNSGEFNEKNKANLDDLYAQLTVRGVTCFNISSELEKQFGNKPHDDYTYKHDLHFKPVGYAAMAHIIAINLYAAGIIYRTEEE